MNNIVLIGFMGTGKTTISECLKEKHHMEIVEMDQILAEREGMAISEIFEKKGEQYFRDQETALLKELQGRKNMILSCGGGTAMRDCNVAEMKKNGMVVLLTATSETIYERVKYNHDRPLLENNMNVEYIAQLQEKRRAKYEAAADVIVSTDGKTVEQIVREIEMAGICYIPGI